MISSFGRGFDSVQLHLKTNESSDYQSFFFLWVFSLIPLFIVDLLFFLFLDTKSISYTYFYSLLFWYDDIAIWYCQYLCVFVLYTE